MSPLEFFRRWNYKRKRRKLIEKLMHAKWSPAIEAQAESRLQRFSEQRVKEQEK